MIIVRLLAARLNNSAGSSQWSGRSDLLSCGTFRYVITFLSTRRGGGRLTLVKGDGSDEINRDTLVSEIRSWISRLEKVFMANE